MTGTELEISYAGCTWLENRIHLIRGSRGPNSSNCSVVVDGTTLSPKSIKKSNSPLSESRVRVHERIRLRNFAEEVPSASLSRGTPVSGNLKSQISSPLCQGLSESPGPALRQPIRSKSNPALFLGDETGLCLSQMSSR